MRREPGTHSEDARHGRAARRRAWCWAVISFLPWCIALGSTCAATAEETQARIAHDLEEGRPIVVHVIVALNDQYQECDRRAARNLFWGQEP
jgi:hypothetical protein